MSSGLVQDLWSERILSMHDSGKRLEGGAEISNGISWYSECFTEVTNGASELSSSLEVSDRRRNTPKAVQIRSESLCAGLWVLCRIFWAWFGPVVGPNPARNRRLPDEFLKVFGALLAQPKVVSQRKVLYLAPDKSSSEVGGEGLRYYMAVHQRR